MLESVHMEFNIQNKVVLTTTDNGSNFVKAFSVFAAEEKVTEDEESDEEADVEFRSHENAVSAMSKDKNHMRKLFSFPNLCLCQIVSLSLCLFVFCIIPFIIASSL